MDAEVEIRRVNAAGKLKATADAILRTEQGEVTLRLRVLENNSGELWVGYPQDSYKKNEETKYSPMVIPSRTFKRWLDGKVLEAFKALAV
jgi:DNA-binding cell septation regulator SpoVG